MRLSGVLDEVRLRGYRREDLDTLFRLDERCFEPVFRFSRATMRRFAEAKRARVIVAEAGNEIVAFCITHVEKAVGGCAGYIVTLDVEQEWRRRGLARVLMLNAEAQVRGEGCRAMLLHVFTGNDVAIRFYEQMGFARMRLEPGFYGGELDAWVYRKWLMAG